MCRSRTTAAPRVPRPASAVARRPPTPARYRQARAASGATFTAQSAKITSRPPGRLIRKNDDGVTTPSASPMPSTPPRSPAASAWRRPRPSHPPRRGHHRGGAVHRLVQQPPRQRLFHRRARDQHRAPACRSLKSARATGVGQPLCPQPRRSLGNPRIVDSSGKITRCGTWPLRHIERASSELTRYPRSAAKEHKMSDAVKINRGLKGIYFERSGASDIDGAAGKLSYRGYDIDDLAEHSTLRGSRLPADPRRAADSGRTGRLRRRAESGARAAGRRSIDIIRATSAGHPMDVLRTCVSALAALEPASAAGRRGGVPRATASG